MNFLCKKIFLVFVVCFIFLVFPDILYAQEYYDDPILIGGSADNLLWGGFEGEIQDRIGLGSRDPRLVIASTLNVLIGFVGIVALLIIILAGFKWMTSGGNEEVSGAAKKMLASGAVGLVIVLASFGIAQFAISSIASSTGAEDESYVYY